MRLPAILGLAAISSSFAFVPHVIRRSHVRPCTVQRLAARLFFEGGSSEVEKKLEQPSEKIDLGTVLVSGFLNSTERADNFVFDVLQAQSKWSKIVAFSPSNLFAKKRLVSRRSRYSGLLDVLDFDEGNSADPTVMQKKLEGCNAWLCFDCDGDVIKDYLGVAKAAGVKSIVMTSSISAEAVASKGIDEALKASGLEYTFIRVGEIVDGREGGPVRVANLTDVLPVETIARDDIIRLSAEAFLMENATNKAFSFGTGEEIHNRYIMDMRREGLDRRAELSNMISGGFEGYRQKILEKRSQMKPKLTPEEAQKQEEDDEEATRKHLEALQKKSQEDAMDRIAEHAFKEADIILKKEWTKLYWARDTRLTLEQYKADEKVFENAFRKGYEIAYSAAMKKFGKKVIWQERDEEDGEDSKKKKSRKGKTKRKKVEEDVVELTDEEKEARMLKKKLLKEKLIQDGKVEANKTVGPTDSASPEDDGGSLPNDSQSKFEDPSEPST